MATSFTDLDQLWDNALELPIGGVTYRIEDPSAEVGLYCRRMWETSFELAAAQKAGDERALINARSHLERFNTLGAPAEVPEGMQLWQYLLGDAYQKMVDNGVRDGMIRHAGQTAIFWVAAGEDAARAYWLSAGRPNAEALNRAARRQQNSSRSTAAESGTRTPASSSTTTSPRNGSRRRGKRRRSPGPTS